MALTDNLVAYYKLDESSGNASSSVGSYTLTNTGTASYSSAKINNGIDFGTTNTTKWLNYLSGNLGITGGACTISGWIKLNTEIASGNWDLINQSSTTNRVWQYIEYEYNGGSRRLGFYRDKGGVGAQGPTYTITLGTSTWYYITYTYDGTNVRGYVNGSLVAGPTAASGNGSANATNGFSIGDRIFLGGALGNKASSIQDETGLWSRALSDSEISELYNSGAGLAYDFSGGGGGGSSTPTQMLMGIGT